MMNQPDNSSAARQSTPAARPVVPVEPAAPLTETHFQLLRQAVALRRPVRNAARTARVSAITILVIGVAGIPIAFFFPSWLGSAVVAGICTIGVIEYIGAQRMRRGELAAAVFLGRNQLAFLTLIVAYCLIQMLTFSPAQTRSALDSPELQPAFSQMPELRKQFDGLVQSFAPIATYGFYSLVIVLSIAAQGGLAFYYFRRRRHLAALQRGTPAWIQRLFAEVDL